MTSTSRQIEAPFAPIKWDNHLCLPIDPIRNQQSLSALTDIHQAGVDVVSINAAYGKTDWDECLLLLGQMRNWLAERPDQFRLVETAHDIELAAQADQLSVVFDVEGADLVGDNFERISHLQTLGVRWMSLTYNLNNEFAGGCHDDDSGLTENGRQLIAAMSKARILPCLSHCGSLTALDACEASNGPVILSHSNPRDLVNHPRNAPDTVIRAVAQTGGLIGVTGVNAFLGIDKVTAEDLARAASHVAHLVGPEHVNFALDYAWGDGGFSNEIETRASFFPDGFGYDRLSMFSPLGIGQIAIALSGLGWQQSDIDGAMGGNLWRLAETYW